MKAAASCAVVLSDNQCYSWMGSAATTTFNIATTLCGPTRYIATINSCSPRLDEQDYGCQEEFVQHDNLLPVPSVILHKTAK